MVNLTGLQFMGKAGKLKMNHTIKRLYELFGHGGKAHEPDAPYICPYPWFVERERELQEEEKARQAAASTSEQPQPTDKQ